MNKLHITVGLPQSGKSTWCKREGHLPVVNPDSIRLALHGMPFISEAEPFVWAIAKVMVKALFLAGHNNVIVDATNTTKKARDKWKSSFWVREFAIFGGPEMKDICLGRAETTCITTEHLKGLRSAINRMSEQWEDVTEDEGNSFKVR